VVTGEAAGLRYLAHDDVVAACAEIDPVDVIRRVLVAHAGGQTILPDEAYLEWTTPAGDWARSLSMPGAVLAPDLRAGTKVINACPANITRGIDRAAGLLVLFDPATAHPRCVMSGTHISALRTACVSLLGATLFAPEPASLAVIGAGVLAQMHVRLFAERLPSLRRVRVFDLRPDAAQRLCDALAPSFGAVEFTSEPSAEAAVKDADVVIPVTTTTDPYIEAAWLRRPSVLVNVSLDDATREVLLGADALVVDDWHLVEADRRRLLGRLAAAGEVVGPGRPLGGAVRAVDAELGALLADPASPVTTRRGIAVVNPFGLAIADVGLGDAVYRLAAERGWGVTLPR